MLPKLKRYRLVFDFLQERKVYPFYIGVQDTFGGYFFSPQNKPSLEHSAKNIHVVNYIPPFLRPRLDVDDDSNMPLNVITLHYINGFMADLTEYSNINDYLVDKMSSKSRTRIRSYVRKLESCFNISYKIYFGEIPKPLYDNLFVKFRLFLEQRFMQRGQTHELLAHWETIQKNSYGMIQNKMASLFVIYNENEPIDICLNYHFGKVLHNGIRSYDIAYSRFRLGYVDIMKQLEWCFENEIQVFDLGVGEMEYKRKWCNVVYDFEHQIIYGKNSFKARLMANYLRYFYPLKEFFKKTKLRQFYYKIRKLFVKKLEQKNKYQEPLFEIVSGDIPPNSNTHGTTLLDLSNDGNAILRKAVYDFQYTYLETSNETRVYRINDTKMSFLIKGKRNTQRLKMIS